jgi:mRNA interferase RelE/StbE
MAWQVIFTKKAQKQINFLDMAIQSRLKKAIVEKLMLNPALYLEPLAGELGGYYKFRMGDYRLICTKENEKLIVIVVELGHRKEVYKH